VDKLDLHAWRRCLTLPADYRPPADACIRLALDGSPSAEAHSDESVITVGHFTSTNAEPDGGVAFLDCIAGRFRGMALPDRVVAAMDLWRPQRVFIECNRQHGGELLVDAIKFRAEMKGVPTGRIVSFSASNQARAKIRRIRKVEDQLVQQDPTLLKIRRGSFVEKLMSEVENFTFDPENHGRGDSCLDSLSYLCFGSAA
jgi:hypothetical protein